MSDCLTYDLDDGVARITMNDGKVNVMSIAMLGDLNRALERAEEEARLVVIRSALPGIFSAGFDLKTFAANDAEKSLGMVKAGGELALRLMAFPMPTIGVMEGHAFPMGTFILLACDIRIGVRGPYRMGLNEVAIRITPPGFAIELARSRLHPAWLSRTVTLGEMFEPDEAAMAGLLDRVVPADAVEASISEAVQSLEGLHLASHTAAKQRLRAGAMTAMRHAIDTELTVAAYRNRGPSSVKLPGGDRAPR